MKRRHFLSLVLAVLMIATVVLALASCGSAKKGTVNFTVPEGGYDGSEVTITFYHTMGTNLMITGNGTKRIPCWRN